VCDGVTLFLSSALCAIAVAQMALCRNELEPLVASAAAFVSWSIFLFCFWKHDMTTTTCDDDMTTTPPRTRTTSEGARGRGRRRRRKGRASVPSAVFSVLFLAWAALKTHGHVGGSAWKAASLLDVASLLLACVVFALLMTRSSGSGSGSGSGAAAVVLRHRPHAGGGNNNTTTTTTTTTSRPFEQPLLLLQAQDDDGDDDEAKHLFPDANAAAAAWDSSGTANPAEEASLGSLMFFSYITKFMSFGRYRSTLHFVRCR
jgi:hypothetical protein